MLGQRRRQLAYINTAFSILQRKQDRSTPAQCFHNFRPALQTMDQLIPDGARDISGKLLRRYKTEPEITRVI